MMFFYAILCIFVYPFGATFTIYVMLWRIRRKLNPNRRLSIYYWDEDNEEATIKKIKDGGVYQDHPVSNFGRFLKPPHLTSPRFVHLYASL